MPPVATPEKEYYEAPPRAKRQRNHHMSEDEKLNDILAAHPRARDKWKEMVSAEFARTAARQAILDEKSEHRRELDRYNAEIGVTENQIRFGARETPEVIERLAYCKERVAGLMAAIREAEDRAADPRDMSVTAVKKFLVEAMNSGRAFRSYVAPSGAPIPADVRNALDEIRDARDRTVDEIKAAEKTPRPRSEAKRRARSAIAAMAEKPNTAGLRTRSGNGSIGWPENPIAILCEVFADELFEYISQRIDTMPEGISEADLADKLATLRANLLALDREEERLFLLAKAAGFDVYRRQTISPLAVLELEFAN